VGLPLTSCSLSSGTCSFVYCGRTSAARGVGLCGEVYDTPLHHQPVFAPYADGPLPGAEWLCERHICLPVSAVMTDDDADYVVESLNAALARMA
jgi:perosamine synthetase